LRLPLSFVSCFGILSWCFLRPPSYPSTALRFNKSTNVDFHVQFVTFSLRSYSSLIILCHQSESFR
jgi:hypothetical protein